VPEVGRKHRRWHLYFDNSGRFHHQHAIRVGAHHEGHGKTGKSGHRALPALQRSKICADRKFRRRPFVRGIRVGRDNNARAWRSAGAGRPAFDGDILVHIGGQATAVNAFGDGSVRALPLVGLAQVEGSVISPVARWARVEATERVLKH